MKVSIIIPVYKVEPYIERCIRSVLHQTYRHLEIILVDDCSPDRSMEIAKAIINDYQNENQNGDDICFISLKHEHNRGVSAARNTGIDAATGEYIFFMDRDDEIIPECIEKMIEVTVKYPEVEMVEGHRIIISQISNKELIEYADIKDIDYIDDNNCIREHFYCWNERLHITPWNQLTRTDFLRNNSLRFKEGVLFEDVIWEFNIAKKLKKYSTLKEKTYIYYKVPNSMTISTSNSVRAQNWKIILHEVANNLDEPHLDRQVAFILLYLIEQFDSLNEERHTYRTYAIKFGTILFKRKRPILSLLLILYVYTRPINRWRKGKRRIWAALNNMCS